MSIPTYHDYRDKLLSLPEAQEDFPFDLDVAVFKVRKKMFATLSEEDGVSQMNLKCDPDQALLLREVYASIIPGYHMNKKHWNTVILDGSVAPGELERLIRHSYGLVVKGMRKADRDYLLLRYGEKEIYGEV